MMSGNDEGARTGADPERKAASLLEFEPEPEAKTRKWSDERKAAHSAKMRELATRGEHPRQKGKKKAAGPLEEPITPEEEQMVGMVFGTLWGLAGGRLKLSPLDQKEQDHLGKAAAPVIRKYLPMIGDWALEINLLMVISALVTAKRMQWIEEHPKLEIMPSVEPAM